MRTTTDRQSYYSGIDRYDGTCLVPETAEDHRAMSSQLLNAAEKGDTQDRLLATLTHAVLALTAPEAPEESE